MVDSIIQYAKDLVANIEAEIKRMVQEAISGILQSIEDAAQAGIDVAFCIGDAIERLEALPGSIIDGAVGCITKQ